MTTEHCAANGLQGHCGCWHDPDDGHCCWCTESNPARILATARADTSGSEPIGEG